MRKVPKRVEFVCNVPLDVVNGFEDVGTMVIPRVFSDTDDRFCPLGQDNFTGPPQGNHAGELVGIYTRTEVFDETKDERVDWWILECNWDLNESS